MEAVPVRLAERQFDWPNDSLVGQHPDAASRLDEGRDAIARTKPSGRSCLSTMDAGRTKGRRGNGDPQRESSVSVV